MKKVSTVTVKQSRNISQQKLTIGLDLGDRNSWYCVLDEVGQIQQEQRVRTTAKALQEVFGKMPRSRIALEIAVTSRPRRRWIDERRCIFGLIGRGWARVQWPGRAHARQLKDKSRNNGVERGLFWSGSQMPRPRNPAFQNKGFLRRSGQSFERWRLHVQEHRNCRTFLK